MPSVLKTIDEGTTDKFVDSLKTGVKTMKKDWGDADESLKWKRKAAKIDKQNKIAQQKLQDKKQSKIVYGQRGRKAGEKSFKDMLKSKPISLPNNIEKERIKLKAGNRAVNKMADKYVSNKTQIGPTIKNAKGRPIVTSPSLLATIRSRTSEYGKIAGDKASEYGKSAGEHISKYKLPYAAAAAAGLGAYALYKKFKKKKSKKKK